MRITKTMFRALATLSLVAAMTTAAQAQSSTATATANASADVVAAIAIAKVADMKFGNVVAGATAGTVVLSTAGTRSATGGTKLGNAGSAAAASFTVTGQGSATYSITLPASASLASGVNSMTVNTFASNPSGTGTLSAGGSQTLAVGATLNVGASQAAGAYTGTFDVTVAYN